VRVSALSEALKRYIAENCDMPVSIMPPPPMSALETVNSRTVDSEPSFLEIVGDVYSFE
jgi:hypothetical protein